jgi:hypothetical protein
MIDPRHLRLVHIKTPDREPRSARMIVSQIAGMPDAYSVRRTGPAEALISRGGPRGWSVLYGFDPHESDYSRQWRGASHLPAGLDHVGAAAYALELADAYALGVPGWVDMLLAAYDTGQPVLDLLRLHAPFAASGSAGPVLPATCTGEGEAASLVWQECPTVRLLAGTFGVTLPDRP